MTPPLVTVVIPAYNCESFIDETLNSVYSQTYENIEVLVIDDGSTDSTKEVLRRQGDRIRYLWQQNQGTAAARNAGLRNANGEFIAFLDNDDVWMPKKIQQQVEALQRFSNCGLVFTNGKTFDRTGIDRESLVPAHLGAWIQKQSTDREDAICGDLFQEFLIANVISSATAVMLRKELAQRLGGFDENIAIAD